MVDNYYDNVKLIFYNDNKLTTSSELKRITGYDMGEIIVALTNGSVRMIKEGE
jgi:hypothetical protein